MVHKQKLRKPKGRGERHSAAWGKRLGFMLVLATSMAFAQPGAPVRNSDGKASRIAPELSSLLAKAHRGSPSGQTIKVIVQYKRTPLAAHYASMKNRGGRITARLHM